MFGTMHVQDRLAFGKLDLVKEKIRSCEIFALELHLDGPAQAQAGKMVLPEGQTLKSLVSPKKYEKLRRMILKSADLDLDHFQRASPFLLTGLIAAKSFREDMALSLDEHLWQFAKQEGKAMVGIETFEEQINVLKKIPLKDQAKMLLEIGRNPKKARHHAKLMAALYQQGALSRLSKCVKKNAGGLRKIMLYHRNEVMAGRIFALAHQATLFAGVGAGHIGGGKGVIRLLKKKGLKLRPVQCES